MKTLEDLMEESKSFEETDESKQKVAEQETLQKTLARNETKAVRGLRIVIALLILVVAVLASVGTYFYSHGTEKREFENAFESQGLKLINGFQGDAFRKFQAMESLSNSFTSYAQASGQEWPFVTVPNSAQHFAPYLSLTNAASLLVMPIVGPRQRYEWETYADANQHWIDRDLQTRNVPVNSTAENRISKYIQNYVGIDTSPNPWIVWWQYAPVIPNRYFVNFNRYSWDGFTEEVKAVKQGRAILSHTWTFEPGLDLQSTKDFDFIQELLKADGKTTYRSGEPIGYIYYPIFDSYDKDTRKTAAVLSATVYWRTYMQNILPESENTGIVCVISNSHHQVYTYKVNGPEAEFIGQGDLHDPQYDDQVLAANYSTFGESQAGTVYTGVPVDTEHISYSIHVYHSSEFEESFLTSKPKVYAACIFAVFLFTASILFLYDAYVEKRQRIVMSSAVTANTVVESLYPSNVRHKIMNDAAHQQKPQHESIFRLKDHSSLTATESGSAGDGNSLADLYPETTIFFADLSGFTKWSSNRSPSEVFQLLETVYGRFDAVALRRRVFKVETVGDCYVAATGIPEPQRHHATIMVRFAVDCMNEMNRALIDLVDTLGEDTCELKMRVGLNSGPTTAGVLRGMKGRFQLFGDTVNTASRMESTGVPGRIHVSKSTANALLAAGKGHWLTEREDKVEAKGKGLLTTFWVSISPASNYGFETSHHNSADSQCQSGSGSVGSEPTKEAKDSDASATEERECTSVSDGKGDMEAGMCTNDKDIEV